ncbi:MAG TPA: hypothetical protein VFC02_09730 [Anaerolineales bacterium]|nr:hypothetical protein [Anaerolineales bacterium]
MFGVLIGLGATAHNILKGDANQKPFDDQSYEYSHNMPMVPGYGRKHSHELAPNYDPRPFNRPGLSDFSVNKLHVNYELPHRDRVPNKPISDWALKVHPHLSVSPAQAEVMQARLWDALPDLPWYDKANTLGVNRAVLYNRLPHYHPGMTRKYWHPGNLTAMTEAAPTYHYDD